MSESELWTCPMHPEVLETGPGRCPLCGMNLVKKTTGHPESEMDKGYTPRPEELHRVVSLLGRRPFLWGILGSGLLLGIYIIVLTLANDFAYALDQYAYLWKWMTPLVAGFGIQVGLFAYMRGFMTLVRKAAFQSVAVWTSTGISTGSMIACCVHHVTDVLPILGLSAAAVFIGQYQTLLLALGIVSNLAGTFYILSMIQKHGNFVKKGKMSSLMGWNMKLLLRLSLALGAVWLSLLALIEIL